MAYTIERLKDPAPPMQVKKFIYDCAIKANAQFGNKFDWIDFPVPDFITDHYFAICWRDQEPVGLMVGSLNSSAFDAKVKILRQVLLFTLPNTRAAYYLLKDFIDFGKVHANHTITTINSETNIKPRSLEKLGFKKSEEYYSLES